MNLDLRVQIQILCLDDLKSLGLVGYYVTNIVAYPPLHSQAFSESYALQYTILYYLCLSKFLIIE
jgi:hypothetical protein